MGRIKTKLIKRSVHKIMHEHPEMFNNDFEHNKKAIVNAADIPSKKMRNVMSGYVTRLVKAKTRTRVRKVVSRDTGREAGTRVIGRRDAYQR